MNGEVRDREKVMRGLKRTDTAVLTGYQLYHNYFRPHEALKGRCRLKNVELLLKDRTNGKRLLRTLQG